MRMFLMEINLLNSLSVLIVLASCVKQGWAVTDCISSPCENGATCVPLPGGYECSCLNEYYGARCEDLNPCLKFDYCADHGNCSSIQGSTWDCDCFPGYVGYKCKHIDSCASSPCPEGTTCQNVWPSSYRCICEQHGYYGAECDNFNACSSSPCLNGGKCLHISSQEYNCDCNPDEDVTGYYGQNCENFDPCLPEPCNELGGTCRNISDTDYFCECFLGFHGNFCSSYDVCLTSPCLNDGICESYNNGTNYTCHCPPIYQGSHCERLRQCLGDVTVDIKGIISWPDIDVGTNTSSQCASGGNNVSRRCYFDETKSATRWTFPDTTECEKANLTNEVAATMTSYLRESTGSNPAEMGDSEVSSASELLNAVVEFSYEQHEMAGNMMECVSNLLEVEDHVLESSARNSGADTRLLNLLKNYASNAVLDEDEDDVTFDTNNLRYKVQKVDPSVFREFESTTYTAHFGNDTDESNGVSIYLPHSIIPPDTFAASHGLRMRFTALKNSKIFVNNDTEQLSIIDSDSQFIISAELTRYRVSDLSVPIEYSVPTPKDGRNYTCVYWNTAEKRWSRHGLKDISSDVNTSYCSSNHLTYFAVILDTGYSEPIPEEHHLPLQIISHLGTACSVFGLVATIITYSIFKILRRTSSGKILIHLSTSLLALNITFVVDTVSKVTDSRLGCKIIAMLLQYFVLTTFLWMAMEAVNMYRTLVQVFQKKSATHFVLKGAVLAWGLPIVPIIITATLDIDLYRKLPLNEICMISTSNSYLYYGGYLGPCCVLLLANFIVFSMILRTVCASKKDLHQRSKRVRRTQIGCALSVTFLLGITWVLGFFAIQSTTLVFTYLVCIINPLQGFFIFLFRCALYPEALRSWTIFCTKHTTNVEKQQRSSSQAIGRRNTISSGDKVGNGKKYSKDAEKLISGRSGSTSSSKRNSQLESVMTKATDMTSVHFYGGLKHENFVNVNSNNSNRRKITDIRFINIKVKDSTS